MKTYELKKIEIEGVDACFVKYAQIKHIQKKFHKGSSIGMRNGVTKLCQNHYSEKGFTPAEFTEITGKKLGQCPPYIEVNGKAHTSVYYGIWNDGNQVELVKDLTAYNSEVEITNCDNYHDGYCKMQYEQIEKALTVLQAMKEADIYTLSNQ